MEAPIEQDIHARLRSIISVGLEIGNDFLDKSKFGAPTKILVNQAANRIVVFFTKQIDEMSEEDILKQLRYVRDVIIPYLIGEVENGSSENKDKG
jgi:hypothetical protein